MFHQTLTNLIGCLIVPQKLHTKVAQRSMLKFVLGRFDFLQNEFEEKNELNRKL